MLITKINGEKEEFDRTKLIGSLRRAGVGEDLISDIVMHIEAELSSAMTTRDIYSHAYTLLAKKEKKAAAKYSMRRAVLDLGPSGFPFEQLVANIYKAKGYSVSTDGYVKGHCAEHEIDIIAHNEDELIMLEAKFHNQDGVKSDLKVALYVKARFDDLSNADFSFGGINRKLTKGILITNTKFTHTAVEYAKCAGLNIIGWNYPHEYNLQDMIQESGLHPITCLNNLSKKDKSLLLEKNIVLLKELLENRKELATIGVDREKQKHVIDEIEQIIN